MISLKVKLFRIIIKDPPHMEKDLQKVKDSEDWEQFSKKLLGQIVFLYFLQRVILC